MHASFPSPDFLANAEVYQLLQEDLLIQFEQFFPDPLAPKTVVILPSLTLDPQILSKIVGHIHYEERLLCMLMLLRMPRTHVVYLSSMPIDEVIIDYYLHLLPGITGLHARKRLHLLCCYDASNRSLTEKVLSRPRLIKSIRECIPKDHAAHLSGFNITPLEEELAYRIGIPLYGCPSSLNYWGTKSGSREVFQRAGVAFPPGFENLRNMGEAADALEKLKAQHPHLSKAMVKLNDGFSGDGNAIFYYENHSRISEEVLRRNLRIVAAGLDFDTFATKFHLMGGIVEAFLDGGVKASPSVQCRITPMRKVDVISTHDQVLDRETGMIYMGASFPANEAYRREIGHIGMRIARELKSLGVLGRFGVDFMSVEENGEWRHYAIEINLRKGGTTHPFLMLQFLTDGQYDYEEGVYKMPNGQTRYYFTTDGLQSEAYKTLTPEDLIDLAICNQVHFDGTTQDGVMFHLIGALSEHGKLGVLSVGNSPEQALEFYHRTVDVLDRETG